MKKVLDTLKNGFLKVTDWVFGSIEKPHSAKELFTRVMVGNLIFTLLIFFVKFNVLALVGLNVVWLWYSGRMLLLAKSIDDELKKQYNNVNNLLKEKVRNLKKEAEQREQV